MLDRYRMISFIKTVKGNSVKAQVVSSLDINGPGRDQRILRLQMARDIVCRIGFREEVEILKHRILLAGDQNTRKGADEDQKNAQGKDPRRDQWFGKKTKKQIR